MVVTGRVGGGTGYDYGTVKYNSNGDSLWVRIYNGFVNFSDEAYAVITDSSDNVYITGRSERDIYSTLDIVSIRYSVTGAQQWLMRYPGTGPGASTRGLIAIDNFRNIFVSGSVDNGPSFRGDYVTIKYSQLVAITPISNILPGEFSISNNPNPFNSQTTILINIPFKSLVNIKIFDVLGKEVAVLVNHELNPGTYEVLWNAEKVSSGVYFYRIEAGSFVDTKKMVLVK